MPKFQPFLMERWMSKFEQDVEFNLSESGVYPILLKELLSDDPSYVNELLTTDLNYPHVNGIPSLRENIAAMYKGATIDNILVTSGAVEANYNATLTLLGKGDEIVIMLPNYMQIWGIAKNHNFKFKTFHLLIIAVCNPNNPTGYILTPDEIDSIVSIAENVGAWILADEVYSGAERLTDKQTPSFFGLYEKVITVGSMSKAYGLPGLRIGWAVAPIDTIEEIWARHEYTTISATMLSNKLAAIALSPEVRPRIIQRTRDFIRNGYPILQKWMDSHEKTFNVIPPQAAAIAFVRYNLNINSTEFAERLRKEKSVFIVPGDHFGMDKFFRISFGLPQDYLTPALNRIHDLILEINK
ncbi:MAG: aminotransferase class I/II-fold pyridoxal phosphate-dependent enzyme [Promethearchaeota archaeon]|jgi:aspartate/methionine/tyrosine aminotransferase